MCVLKLKNINHPSALVTAFYLTTPAPWWSLAASLHVSQIAEQSLFFAFSVAGWVAVLRRSGKSRGKTRSRKLLGLEWQVDKTAVTPLILPLYFGTILCTLQLSVRVNLGQAESALFRIRLLTQTERKRHKSTGSLTRVTAVGNWEDFWQKSFTLQLTCRGVRVERVMVVAERFSVLWKWRKRCRINLDTDVLEEGKQRREKENLSHLQTGLAGGQIFTRIIVTLRNRWGR